MRSEQDLTCSDTLAWQEWLARKGSNKSLIRRETSPKSNGLCPFALNAVPAVQPRQTKARFPATELTSREGHCHTVLYRGLNSVLDTSPVCQGSETW